MAQRPPGAAGRGTSVPVPLAPPVQNRPLGAGGSLLPTPLPPSRMAHPVLSHAWQPQYRLSAMENTWPKTQYLKFFFHFSGVTNTETQPVHLKSRHLSTLGSDFPQGLVGCTRRP